MIQFGFEIKDNKVVINNKGDEVIKLMGIDPGTVNLGITIITFKKKVMEDKLSLNNIDSIKTFNIRVKGNVKLRERIQLMGKILERIMEKERPYIVGVETAYINIRRVTAVIPLSRLFETILTSCRASFIKNYIDGFIYEIAPTTAKKTARVYSKKNTLADKDGMRDMLISNVDITKKIVHDIANLSEHEIDSVFIALSAMDKHMNS